jgi:hypothetical protein
MIEFQTAEPMDIVARARRNALMLLLAAIALRAIIPVGYMPGSLGGELLFEMCPEGMPSAMVQALGGKHHHGGGDDEAATPGLEQCPMGHLLTPAAATNSSTTAALAPPHRPVFLDVPRFVAVVATPIAYFSRAPPVIT